MTPSTELPGRPPLLDDRDRPEPPRVIPADSGYSGNGLKIFIGVFSLILFSAIVWYAYSQGKLIGSEESAPLISAEKSPVRVRPENPGGLQVPYQDKLIFQKENQTSELQLKSVESLLPRPEKPSPMSAKADPSDDKKDFSKVTDPQSKPVNLEKLSQTRNNKKPRELIPSNVKKDNTSKQKISSDRQNIPPGLLKDSRKKNEQLSLKSVSNKNNDTNRLAHRKTVKKKPPANFRIQVASFRKESSARSSWRRLQKLHKSSLGKLVLTIEKTLIAEKGVFFRTQGGPLTEKQARQICKRLIGLKQGCLVISP